MDKSSILGGPRPGAKPLANAEMIALLNGLIETCRDGEAGFRHAASDVTNASLKALFTRFSVQRGDFATELAEHVRRLGGVAETGGTLAGALHRGWIDAKATFTGRDDDAILTEAEQGEDAAKRAYEGAMSQVLPVELQAVVTRQYDAVRRAHDQIRDLRDLRVAR